MVNRGKALRNGLDVFHSPNSMLMEFEDYMDWVQENPFMENVIYGVKGQSMDISKMRMPSLQEFCMYIRTTSSVIKSYAMRGGEWAEVVEFMSECIHAVSLGGAAAGLLKESIVSKKLGLIEKVEKNVNHTRILIHAPTNSGRMIEADDSHNLLGSAQDV